jgi:hypothetical protein
MPKVKTFKKVYSSDQVMMRVQDSITDSIQSLTKIPILEANLVANVSVSTTATGVEHGLNRQPLGFIVVDRTSNTQVWRSATPSAAPEKLLMLEASATTTISILIF